MNLQSGVGEIITPCYRHQGQRLGKTVVNSQLSHAGIANDVLRQVPMVTGIDGNYFMAIATMSTQGQNTLVLQKYMKADVRIFVSNRTLWQQVFG